MYSMFPKDTFYRSSLKSAIFLLAQVHNILPAPMVEILKRGRDHWRSVLEQQSRQPNLVVLFALMHVRLLFPSLHGAFLRIENQFFFELYPSLWLFLNPRKVSRFIASSSLLHLYKLVIMHWTRLRAKVLKGSR